MDTTQTLPVIPRNDKLIAAGCYLPVISILFIIYSILKKVDNSFVVYHAKNGIALFVLSFVSIFAYIIPLVGGFISFIFLIADIYGIYLALKGKTTYFPVVTALANLIKLGKVYTVLTGKENESPSVSAQETAPAQAAAVPAVPVEQAQASAPAQNQEQTK